MLKPDPLSELRFRIRAEEMRALAGDITIEENRKFYNSIAEDYERLARSAEVITGAAEKLDRIGRQLGDSSAADTGSTPSGSGTDPLGAGDVDRPYGRVQVYRDMADDAKVLAKVADNQLRGQWLQLSRRWSELADRLEEQGADQRSRNDHD